MALACVFRRSLLLAASLPLFALPALGPAFAPAFAQDIQEEEDDASQLIIVTGSLRQGGAQDVQHFRSISMDDFQNRGLPDTHSLTIEGLLGEHDLTLPSTTDCLELFCIAAHTMPAQLSGRDNATHFIGLGFETGIDADEYRAMPVSVIALIDRSGSMSGEPMDRVKEGLHALVDQLRPQDRLGIVIYGSSTVVHQKVIDAQGNKDSLHRAINSIGIDGATYMEAGMQLGFETAFEELAHSNGRTRLMLFTDENPNVGNTDPEGFMGQALAGSQRGVGMTTIGVGVHYDGALATKISSVRGGNLFFLAEEGSGGDLFDTEFENMVSEVAHDLVFSITPSDGYSVSDLFGVPGEIIEYLPDGSVNVTIGSAFLSSNGGGIYAALQGDGEPDGEAGGATLANVSVTYVDALDGETARNSAQVLANSRQAPENLAKAQLLVEEYLVLNKALDLYHETGDAAVTAQMLTSLSERIEQSGFDGMGEEQKLVNRLRLSANRLAGIEGGPTLPWDVIGDWEVQRVARVDDLTRGDLVAITENGEFITKRNSGRDQGETIYQEFAINERQLHIDGTRLIFDYSLRGDRLRLRDRLDGTEIILIRQAS